VITKFEAIIAAISGLAGLLGVIAGLLWRMSSAWTSLNAELKQSAEDIAELVADNKADHLKLGERITYLERARRPRGS